MELFVVILRFMQFVIRNIDPECILIRLVFVLFNFQEYNLALAKLESLRSQLSVASKQMVVLAVPDYIFCRVYRLCCYVY